MSSIPFDITDPQALQSRARELISESYGKYHPYHGFSTTSCQIYDTAWVAMVTKTLQSGEIVWAFPKCFQYLLASQADDGSWGMQSHSQTAGILDTAAALLALHRHLERPLQIDAIKPSVLEDRIKKATEALIILLKAWSDVVTTNHIGVEVIMPHLLEELRKLDPSLRATFDAEEDLMRMNREKLTRFKASSLYHDQPSSALHSLEAFLGKIDFDAVGHHLHHGSMMASPSSTAAYLIGSSKYNPSAEEYLTHVAEAGSGRGTGGIPGTFPTTFFELSWVRRSPICNLESRAKIAERFVLLCSVIVSIMMSYRVRIWKLLVTS